MCDARNECDGYVGGPDYQSDTSEATKQVYGRDLGTFGRELGNLRKKVPVTQVTQIRLSAYP